MDKRRLRWLVFGGVVALLSLGIAVGVSAGARDAAPSQPLAGYQLTWWTVDGGGHTRLSGGDYTLGGTAGQPDAGLLAGPGYMLVGGFWAGASSERTVFLPLVVRDS